MKTGLTRRTSQEGQGLAEFAIVISVLLLGLFAVFDFGRAIYAYHTIGNAARAGARVAIVNQTPATIRQKGADQAVALGIAPADIEIVGYKETLDPDLATDPDAADDCPAVELGCIAVIRVRYTFDAITPIIGNIVGPISMASTAQLPVESVCSNTPPRCP